MSFIFCLVVCWKITPWTVILLHYTIPYILFLSPFLVLLGLFGPFLRSFFWDYVKTYSIIITIYLFFKNRKWHHNRKKDQKKDQKKKWKKGLFRERGATFLDLVIFSEKGITFSMICHFGGDFQELLLSSFFNSI